MGPKKTLSPAGATRCRRLIELYGYAMATPNLQSAGYRSLLCGVHHMAADAARTAYDEVVPTATARPAS